MLCMYCCLSCICTSILLHYIIRSKPFKKLPWFLSLLLMKTTIFRFFFYENFYYLSHYVLERKKWKEKLCWHFFLLHLYIIKFITEIFVFVLNFSRSYLKLFFVFSLSSIIFYSFELPPIQLIHSFCVFFC